MNQGTTKIHGSKTSTTDATWLGTKVHSHVRQAARAEISGEMADYLYGDEAVDFLAEDIQTDRELAEAGARVEAMRAAGAPTCLACDGYECDCPADMVEWYERQAERAVTCCGCDESAEGENRREESYGYGYCVACWDAADWSQEVIDEEARNWIAESLYWNPTSSQDSIRRGGYRFARDLADPRAETIARRCYTVRLTADLLAVA